MKKYLFALATLAIAVVACNKETDVQQPDKAGKRMITVIAETPETRTVLDDQHNALLWAPGDNFRLMTNTKDADANHDAQTLNYTENGKFSVLVSNDATEAYAYYFAGTFEDEPHSTPSAFSAYINPTQSQTEAGVLNGQNLPMAAKGTINSDNTVSLDFHQMAGVLALNVYSSEKVQGETIKSIKVTPSSSNTKFCGQKASTDLTAANAIYDEGTSTLYSSVTVTLDTPYDYVTSKPEDKKAFDKQIYVVLAKQSYAEVEFEITTNFGVYTIKSNTTAFDLENNDFYPVNINLKKATYAGMDVVDNSTADYTTGFETGFTTSTTYNNTTEKFDGPSGKKWASYYGTVSTSSALSGSNSMQLRWYPSATDNLGYARTNFVITNVALVSFKAAATNDLKLGLYYKTTEDWVLANTFDLTTTSGDYFCLFTTPLQNAQLKFQIILPETNPSSNSNIRIDDVVVKATLPTYSVTISSAITHGTVTASPSTATPGEEVTLSITPEDGWELDELAVTGAGGTQVDVNDNKFIMPAENVTVSARFIPEGGGEMVIYSETFGTIATKSMSVSDYTGWSWTGSLRPTGAWLVSKNDLTTTNVSTDAYDGASGSCNLYSGTKDASAIFAFGNVSTYSDVVLSFGWANNAGKSKQRTMKVEVSGDGGQTWTSITFTNSTNATTNDGFHLSTYSVPTNMLNNFSVRFTNTSTNTSRLDDVKLVGIK